MNKEISLNIQALTDVYLERYREDINDNSELIIELIFPDMIKKIITYKSEFKDKLSEILTNPLEANLESIIFSVKNGNDIKKLTSLKMKKNEMASKDAAVNSTENNSNVDVIKESKVETTEDSKAETENEKSEDSKAETENEKSEDSKAEATEEENEDDWKSKLTHINPELMYDLMSVPSVSRKEYRIVTYLILWARRNNIDYEFDDKGNVYFTKGTLDENEFYPCVTAHMDTVQSKQAPYAEASARLNVKTRINRTNPKHHDIYVDDFGIGGDDRAGILICLSLFNKLDKLKACFFLEEEVGCLGSKELNVSWFDNVGYVMGFDSPELNRAAHTCNGVRLFSKSFFETYLKDICKEHGLDDFRSEPFTDVVQIREKTDVMCMNFGTGYYNCHCPNEYCVVEEMDNACRMGEALIRKIGNTKQRYEYKGKKWVSVGGVYSEVGDEDEEFFNSLSKTYYYSYGGGYSRQSTYKPNTTSGSSTSVVVSTGASHSATTATATTTNTNTVSKTTLTNIMNTYDMFIKNIKTNVENKCKELGVDFKEFEESFSDEVKF